VDFAELRCKSASVEQEVRPARRPEGELIARALKASGKSVRAAAALAEISDTHWRHIVNGYQPMGDGQWIRIKGPADTIARMAHVVGVTPEGLREAGRPDAAEELERSVPPPQDAAAYVSSGGDLQPGAMDDAEVLELVRTARRLADELERRIGTEPVEGP
jgi:hypothetical protein